MRLGILTFCNAYNLGGSLQAFSLYKVLVEMGQNVEFINYQCPAICNMHRFKPVIKKGLSFKTRVYNFIYNFVFSPRRIRYKLFMKGTHRSKKYTRQNIHETNGLYDVFVSGSDQVFNYSLTGHDKTYFLDYVNSGIKSSYAASLGKYLPELKTEYKNLLESFDFLSFREKSSVEICNNEFGINADVMPDPVFLHSGKEWIDLLNLKKENKKYNYILIYSLIENEELYKIADNISKKKGLKTIVITKSLRPQFKADLCLRNAGPKEFIKLIYNADYVVTNSFHGTAFSLIFEKKFFTLIPPVAPERILDLLNAVDLSDRAISDIEKYHDEEIDYKVVNQQLERMRNIGKVYLKKICCDSNVED